jgi:hypothetical protein
MTRTEAATRRALIVGINTYREPGTPVVGRGEHDDPRVWLNLDGAVKDTTRIHDLLVARYGFDSKDVHLLLEGKATRKAILDAIKTHLIDPSQPGDLAFFYYAGHGSRVKNSLSSELNKLDQSIVPVDAAIGVRDIRDKEIRDEFNKILDTGAQLVAVFDSCHSGGVSRGSAGEGAPKSRMIPFDPRDVKDGSQAPAPWERGALILSAAQDDQLSNEDVDEHGIEGGLFTISMARALRSGSPEEPAQNLFRRVKALMKARGWTQEPALEGSPARKGQSLLGTAVSGTTGRAVTAVQSVRNEKVVLQEGIAAGFTVSSELAKVNDAFSRLRIASVDGLSQSTAEVISGDIDAVHAGDLYVVDRWAPPEVPSLRVWMPRPDTTTEQIKSFAQALVELSKENHYTWVSDPFASQPTHVVFMDGNGWHLLVPGAEASNLGPAPSAEEVGRRITGSNVKIFVNLPPSQELQGRIALGPTTENTAIEWVARSEADYHLIGRSTEDGVSYAWSRPWTFDASGSTLPTVTDWVPIGAAMDTAGSRLERLAVRLGRIRAWLELEGPPNPGQYNYRLALKRVGAEEYLEEGTVFDKEEYELAIQSGAPIKGEWRYVYVFAIDRDGRSTLLYPQQAGVQNRFPPEEDQQSPKSAYVLPASSFKVSTPFGTDTFILLASAEQLPDPSVLEQEGVRTRGPTSRGTALQDLLANVGARTRGFQKGDSAPALWSLDRVTIESKGR